MQIAFALKVSVRNTRWVLVLFHVVTGSVLCCSEQSIAPLYILNCMELCRALAGAFFLHAIGCGKRQYG
jgi:hypothetical protein